MSKKNNPKVVIIGLDAAAPKLLFHDLVDIMPNIKNLLEKSFYGELKSIIPPITTPAWACMTCGRTPGELGVYGFRHRKKGTYNDIWIATNAKIKKPRIWDILGKENKKIILLGVPQTYPLNKVNGIAVAGFLAPSVKADYTYPKNLKEEIEKVVGRYLLDVEEFRIEDKEKIISQLFEMTEKRFKLARYFIEKYPYDFFMMVEMGPDRTHHAFWRFFDKEHRFYQPKNKYENVIYDYYKFLDQEIGKLLNLLDEDTWILIVSDHGTKKADGAIVLNEWLAKKGYLTFKKFPSKEGTKLSQAEIDWSKTKAWAWGGYYARIFLNVKGREKQGIIDPKDYEKERDILKKELEKITDEKGNPLQNKVFKPEEIYPEVKGDPPDLLAFFGNLSWRSAGTVGWNKIHLLENDTGPDDAVHDWDGVFIIKKPKQTKGKYIGRKSIYDIFPTLLKIYNLKIPENLIGQPIKV